MVTIQYFRCRTELVGESTPLFNNSTHVAKCGLGYILQRSAAALLEDRIRVAYALETDRCVGVWPGVALRGESRFRAKTIAHAILVKGQAWKRGDSWMHPILNAEHLSGSSHAKHPLEEAFMKTHLE